MDLQRLHKLRLGAPDCPSDLALDRLHAGELSPQVAAPLSAHLTQCVDCETRMSQRRAGFAAIDDLDPRPILARLRATTAADAPPQQGWLAARLRSTRAVWMPLLATAAALAVFVGTQRRITPPDEGMDTREKGGLGLSIVRFEQGQSKVMLSGDSFRPGDRLRFVVSLPSAGQVSILGVEASGNLYVAWPSTPTTPTQRAAGAQQQLPGAIVLDETTGTETLYLVLCPPESAPPASSCHVQKPGRTLTCQATCQQTPFVLHKRGSAL